MLLYRVIPYLKQALAGRPGHPLYLNPAQGEGRLDNSDRYLIYYFSRESSGAIGEKFSRYQPWTEAMLDCGELDGGVYALATYWLPDDVPLLDMDNPATLQRLGIRPTQVVEPNRSATQEWVRLVYDEHNAQGRRRWDGLRLWSSHRACWSIVGYWGRLNPKVLAIQVLKMEHPAVVDAGLSLGRLCEVPTEAKDPEASRLKDAASSPNELMLHA
jgi:hypothetical protein